MASITFGHPQYLFFLIAVPVLVLLHFYLLRHAKRKAMKFANFVALKRVTGERLITKNYTMLLLRVMVIVCATLAVSQAIFWYDGKANENEYVIALDTSASMTATDIAPTRLDAAKLYGSQFIDAIDDQTRIGLISYSGVTFIEQVVTSDKKLLHEALDPIETTASGTDIPGALITGTNMLADVDKGRAIILITDGSNTIETFQSKSVQRAVGYAKANHVKVFTIGVGSDESIPIGYLPQYYNVTATYNEDNLKYIANETGGQYYRAVDESSLERAYDDIQSSEKQSTLKRELTAYFMFSCLILILVEWLLVSTRFRSLP